MTKQELIEVVAQETGISKKETGETLEAVVNNIKLAVKNGEKVTLVGFGSFEQKLNAARTGINPATKEKIQIKASTSAKFKVGKGFKEYLN